MNEKILNNELLDRFKNHLRAEEKSKNTIEKYIRDVKAFMQYVDGEQIDKEKTISYKDYLIKKITVQKALIL